MSSPVVCLMVCGFSHHCWTFFFNVMQIITTISSRGVLIGLSQAIKSVFMTLTEIAVLIIKLAANRGSFFSFFLILFLPMRISTRCPTGWQSHLRLTQGERPKHPMSSPVINLFVSWIPLQVSSPARVVLWRCGAHGYAFTVTDTHVSRVSV